MKTELSFATTTAHKTTVAVDAVMYGDDGTLIVCTLPTYSPSQSKHCFLETLRNSNEQRSLEGTCEATEHKLETVLFAATPMHETVFKINVIDNMYVL